MSIANKYLRYGDRFVIFGADTISHLDVALKFGKYKPNSAGFVFFKDGKPECYGHSESLSVYSGQTDSADMAKFLGVDGSHD